MDDEMQSRLLIRKLLESHDASFNIAVADSVSAALVLMKSIKPDLIFLDVQMRGETGFDFLDQAGDLDCPVIFTTAHSEHAVRAFRYAAFDYLLKPIDIGDFETALNRVMQHSAFPQESRTRSAQLLQQMRGESILPQKLTIPTAEGFLFLEPKEIFYCMASGNYTEFHLTGKQKVISSYTLGHYEELLADRKFFRVHRSYLINLDHVRMYRKGDGGSVIMQDGKEIEVSRANKDAFLSWFKG